MSRTGFLAFALMAVCLLNGVTFAQTYSASTTNPAPAAQVSFTFDDGYRSMYRLAAPTLKRYGLNATNYVVTGCMGMTNIPNNCHADTDKSYMTWGEVRALQDQYGWEIGSHTVNHPYMASTDAADGQPNMLSATQIESELRDSKSTLAANNINAVSFASPYGDYSPVTLPVIAKYYANHRGYRDTGLNQWPYNEYLIRNFAVENTTSVATIKSQVDQAIASKSWLVLTFHDVVSGKGNTKKNNKGKHTQQYDYDVRLLEQVAAYVKAKQDAGLITNRTMSKTAVTGQNILPNGDFAAGLAAGWTVDDSSITFDTNGRGSFPSAANAVRFATPTTRESHLFSPLVNVSAETSYLLRSYVSVHEVSNGSVGFYVDEYDAGGNWISGQYKKAEPSVFTENLNMSYSPSSTSVAKVRIQVIGSGSVLDASVDNVQLIALSTASPVVRPNMMPNATFDKDLTQTGWRTNSQLIRTDHNNNGAPSGPTNSVRLQSSDINNHLFSPLIPVSSDKSYSVSSYLNIKALASKTVGFYVDEYDAGGNWISGQYKADAVATGSRNISFTYRPTSAQVVQASLQVIVQGGSSTDAYIDDIRWYQN